MHNPFMGDWAQVITIVHVFEFLVVILNGRVFEPDFVSGVSSTQRQISFLVNLPKLDFSHVIASSCSTGLYARQIFIKRVIQYNAASSPPSTPPPAARTPHFEGS